MGATAKKTDGGAESEVDAEIQRQLEAKKNSEGGGSKPNQTMLRLLSSPLPPMRDQERIERADPVHKGKGIGLVRFAYMRHLAKSESIPLEKVMATQGEWGQAALKSAEDFLRAQKSLVEGTLLDGGVLVPPQLSDEFLPLLRAATVMRSGGARVLEVTGQVLDLGRQNGAGTAAYVGEAQAASASQQTFGQLGFAIKKLISLTGMSNDLIRDAGPSAEAKVRDDLIAIMGLKEDITFIRSDGTLGTPRGLRYLTAAANIDATTQAGAAATFQEIAADADRKIYQLRKNKIARYAPKNTWRWIMSPRAEQYLHTVSSTYGVFPFADELDSKGTFRGIPVLVTEAIPENLGGGGNESEVYLVAMPCAMIGDNLALDLMFFPNGAAIDVGGSSVTSGINSDLSWMRAISRHDFQLAYDTACAILTGNKWGA